MNMNKNSMYKNTDSVLLQMLVPCLYCHKFIHYELKTPLMYV